MIECLSHVILSYVILNYVILSEAKDLITNVKDGSTDIIQVHDRWFIDLLGIACWLTQVPKKLDVLAEREGYRQENMGTG